MTMKDMIETKKQMTDAHEALGTKLFCVPHSYDYRKQPSLSLRGLP